MLFRKLGETFDYVIVDTPPLSDYSDGVVAVANCDGALVLTRIGHTTSKTLRRAIQVLDAANATIIGTAVTCEPVTRMDARRNRAKTQAGTDTADGAGAHRVGATTGGNGTDGSEGH